MKINVAKTTPWAVLPTYATDGSGCFDLAGFPVESDDKNPTLTFDTGLKFEIPEGYVMLVYSRSGHGFKQGLRLANCVGVIDSDYRGNVKVKIRSDTPEGNTALGDMFIESEKWPLKIAQAMIIPVPMVSFVEISENELSSTERGEGGFGSTGVTL